MKPTQRIPRAVRWAGAGAGLAAVGYATYVAAAWLRYGHGTHAGRGDSDSLLDRFMPEYDVAERHHTRVAAPAEITLAAAGDTDLAQSVLIRGIFKARELVLGSEPENGAHPKGLRAQMTSLGWGVLAEVPGREVVFGAVTQPWKANVVFRAVPPEAFAAFREPDYVKIVWTLRADPAGASASVFRTETRVSTTDAEARSKFRWYWARFSPGIILIRRTMLRLLRAEAARRAAK